MFFDTRLEGIEKLSESVRGVINDRFERDTRGYHKKVAKGADSTARERARIEYLNQMNDLEMEVDAYSSTMLSIIESEEWSSLEIEEAFDEISYEAREFIGRTILSKLARALFKSLFDNDLIEAKELKRIDKTVERLMSGSAALTYPRIARDPELGTMCPADDFYTEPVIPNPSPRGRKRRLERASSPSLSTTSIDSGDDLTGRNVYVRYPGYGYHWGVVTGIDPRDDSKVILYHSSDGDYRSKKASEVHRMIAKFGDQPSVV